MLLPIVVKAAAFLSEGGIVFFGTGLSAGAALGVASAANNIGACTLSFFSGVGLGGVGGWNLHRYSPEFRELQLSRIELARVIEETNEDAVKRGQAITQLLEDAKDNPEKLVAVRSVLKEIEDSEKPQIECVVCLEEATHAFPECGHMCVCQKCAHNIMTRVGFGGEPRPAQCPMCRARVNRVIRIFTE